MTFRNNKTWRMAFPPWKLFIVLCIVSVPTALATNSRSSPEQGDGFLNADFFLPGRVARSRQYQRYHGHGVFDQFDEMAADWPGLVRHITRHRRRRRVMTNQEEASESPNTRGRPGATAIIDRLGIRGTRSPSHTTLSTNTTTLLTGTNLSFSFRETIKQSGLHAHCQMFQTIADRYGGIRGSGSPGYKGSLLYVLKQLMDAGYHVYTTDVSVQYFEEVLPPLLEGPIDYTSPPNDPMTYYTFPGSASGTVEAPVTPVNIFYDVESEGNNSTSACNLEDFADFPPGNIALISRGSCSFFKKFDYAIAAGASAIIFTNDGSLGREEALVHPFSLNFPVPILYGSSMLGMSILEELEQGNEITLKITTDVIAETRINKNLLAETDHGDDSQVIMIGAHLDSVFEGPGIEDNTSGSSAILELALQFKKHGWDSEEILKNKIRFAWWAGEELGLLGSTQYVEDLSDAEIENIAMYLNIDMIGSPNFVRFVLDGDGSNSVLEPIPQPGSPMAHIEATYHQYFDEVGLPIEEEPYSDSYGATDHTAFYDAGIPISDLHTGIDITKSREQAAIFGGKAGAPMDPCYHQACDTLDNVNFTVMEQMTRAAAHVLAMYGTKEGDLFA